MESRSVLAVLLFWQFACSFSSAELILESAKRGAVNQHAGVIVAPFQYLGARFHVEQTTLIEQIGGHLSRNFLMEGTHLFGAITEITGPNGFPTSSPADFQPLAVRTFSLGTSSSDISVPLNVILAPGDYALVFGSGRFGATASGFMPDNNIDTAQASYFFVDFPHLSTSDWQNETTGKLRFVVIGTPIPEPATSLLLPLATFGLFFRRRSC